MRADSHVGNERQTWKQVWPEGAFVQPVMENGDSCATERWDEECVAARSSGYRLRAAHFEPDRGKVTRHLRRVADNMHYFDWSRERKCQMQPNCVETRILVTAYALDPAPVRLAYLRVRKNRDPRIGLHTSRSRASATSLYRRGLTDRA